MVKSFEANGPLEAERRCPRPRGNYIIELVAAGSPARESGGVRTVALREASRTLGSIEQAVTDAVTSDVAQAQDVQVFDDGTLIYRVGEELFQRSWSVKDDQGPQPSISLGASTKVEMVAQPMESYRGLLRVSEAFNPGASDNLHSEFLRGRDSGDSLEDIGRAFGLEGSGLREFMRGRD